MFRNLRMFRGYCYTSQLLHARFPDFSESVESIRTIGPIATVPTIKSNKPSVQFGPNRFACFTHRQ